MDTKDTKDTGPVEGAEHAAADAFVDQARSVRDGEAFDVDALARYLRDHLGGPIETLAAEQFPSGHSNLTYLLRLGARELVLRRPPFGTQVKTAHDMGREYRILSALRPCYPKVPEPLLFCEDDAIIGAPFYVMERVRGVILRGTKPKVAATISPELMRRISEALVDTLVELHAVDVAQPGLREVGHPEGYVRRQVEGWIARYYRAQTDDVPDFDALAAWLPPHMPEESGVALIHNDFKFDNAVLDPAVLTQVRAVLDWEMATVGDPLMDLGTTLGYWLDPADTDMHKMLPLGPTLLPGNLDRAGVMRRYAEKSGRDVGDMLFYYVFAVLKIAVIAQQIYKRFVDGHTKDPRFASMIMGVRILSQAGTRALELGRVDRLG